MGCSSSIPETSRSIDQKMPKAVKQTTREQTVTTIVKTELTYTNRNVQENTSVQRKEHTAIAFAVDMDGNELQRVVGSSGTPKRLKALEPLNVPQFTSEMLEEKQKQLESNSERLEEKMKKAKLQREMKRQELIDKQKQQGEYAKRVREKAKKFKETAKENADTRPWGYSADEGDSDESSDTQKSMEEVLQIHAQSASASKFDSRESENNDNFFDT